MSQSRLNYFLKTLLVYALLHSGIVYGQQKSQKIDLEKLYNSSLENHLFPPIDSTEEEEVILFVAKPSFNPEYSIRIVHRKNRSFIEARFLKRELWSELLINAPNHKTEPLSLEVNLISMPISNEFENMFHQTITKISAYKYPYDEMALDGISYLFRINNGTERVLNVDVINPQAGTNEERLTLLCTGIANDLKNHMFDECRYLVTDY